jgi:hypothetical protein
MKRRPRAKTESYSLLEPRFDAIAFDDFAELAENFDWIIQQFYRYYRERGFQEPNLFGFVSVRHMVRISDQTDEIYTENVLGEKTTVIHAPAFKGETAEQQYERSIQLLAAFDHTKRASHILALSLLLSMIRRKP